VATLRTPFTTKTGLFELLERLGPLKWVMLALFVLGAGLITLGAFEGHYLQSVLLEIGAALLLVAPFIFLERVTTSRISEVRSEVAGVQKDVQRAQTRIEDVGRATAALITAERKAETDALEALRFDPSEEKVWQALHKALEEGAIDPRGVRVRLPDGDRVRFTPLADSDGGAGTVAVALENRSGDQLPGTSTVKWRSEEPAALPLARLGKYREVESFDATSIFNDLVNTLEVVLSSRVRGREGRPLGSALELLGEWAVTANGLEHVDDENRFVRARDLFATRDREKAKTRLLADNPNARTVETFSEAFATAAEYHKGDRRREAAAAARQRGP
jgi:hypothetical protein